MKARPTHTPASSVARPLPLALVSLAIGCTLLLLAGCTGEPADGPAADATDREAELERLRALGYVGFTDTKVDPDADPVTLYDEARSEAGFNLISNRDLVSAQLFDMKGRVLRNWQDHGCSNWSNAELLPDGDLLVTGSEGQQEDRNNFLLRMSFDGDVVWRTMINAHHDAEQTPDGNIATLTFDFRLIPEIDPKLEVKDHKITLVTPQGEVIEEHSIYDMFCTDPAFTCRVPPPKRMQNSAFIDLLHANSIEFMRQTQLFGTHPLYAPTHVLISMRSQDAIAIFDWKTRRLVWSWGPGEISAQHDATLLPSGHILLFDNGLDKSRSRIIELDPVNKKIVWEYQAPNPTDFFSLRKGSSQRLSNGNTLISNSDKGEAFEVTPEGRMVWRFLNPNADPDGNRATIVRIHRYPESFIRGLMEKHAP